MRSRVLIVTMLLCFILIGCSNNNAMAEKSIDMVSVEEYNKVVEERDHYKKLYEEILKDTENERKDQQDNEDVKSSRLTDFEDYNYFIDELSVDEIVDECMKILENVPKVGTTVEEYESTFRNEPLNTSIDEYNMLFYFVHNYDPYGASPKKNAIVCIMGNNIGLQMDGTLAVRSDQYDVRMEMELCITDYQTASEVYDKLYQILTPGYEKLNRYEDGTTWRVEAAVINQEGFPYPVDLLKLDKIEDGYRLHIAKPVID